MLGMNFGLTERLMLRAGSLTFRWDWYGVSLVHREGAGLDARESQLFARMRELG